MLTDGGGADGGGFLNAQEVVIAARLQVRACMGVHVYIHTNKHTHTFLYIIIISLTPKTQIEALRESGHGIGDGFVTLAVNTTGAAASAAAGKKKEAGAQHSVEAFQVRL